jgi:glycosyltransferase involved in cell wall biosynthesis
MLKKKILCIDIEGGKGGSSRSLYFFLEAISRNFIFPQLDITVICRRNSWVKKEYENLGIKCIICEHIPRFTSLVKNSRNIYQLVLFLLLIWPKSSKFRKKMKQMKNFDVIHFNHISLAILAWWCNFKNIGNNRVMHIRTIPPKNIFSKALYKLAKNSCNSFIYITHNEKKHLHQLIGVPRIKEQIIYNPVKSDYKKKVFFLKNDERLKIGILSNFSYDRGVDRTLDIFESIPIKQRHKFVLVFAGNMNLERNIPGIPNIFFKNKKTFSDFVISKGFKDNFIFLGQLNNPEKLLQSIDVLLKPTRLNNPWGRDILEALAMGKPIISIGTYKKFVESNKTGFLQKIYNPNKIVDWLLNLESNKNNLENFSTECKNRIKMHCSPNIASKKLLNLWLQK